MCVTHARHGTPPAPNPNCKMPRHVVLRNLQYTHANISGRMLLCQHIRAHSYLCYTEKEALHRLGRHGTRYAHEYQHKESLYGTTP